MMINNFFYKRNENEGKKEENFLRNGINIGMTLIIQSILLLRFDSIFHLFFCLCVGVVWTVE